MARSGSATRRLRSCERRIASDTRPGTESSRDGWRQTPGRAGRPNDRAGGPSAARTWEFPFPNRSRDPLRIGGKPFGSFGAAVVAGDATINILLEGYPFDAERTRRKGQLRDFKLPIQIGFKLRIRGRASERESGLCRRWLCLRSLARPAGARPLRPPGYTPAP